VVKSTALPYSVDAIDLAWQHHPGHALTMMLKMSSGLALEALQRDLKGAAVSPPPERRDGDALTSAREVAAWAATAVAAAGLKPAHVSKRLNEAAQQLEVIADIQALLASTDDFKLRQAIANAVLHGALLGGFRWRNPPHRAKGTTRRATPDVVDAVLQKTAKGKTDSEAAREVLGKVEHAEEKNVVDHIVKAVRKRRAARGIMST
jgi:hypothetical protein